MTSHLDSHKTTDIKPEMLSGVQTGNEIPHDDYNIRGIAHRCSQTEKTTFHAKTPSAELYIYIGVGSRDLFIDEATKHTRRWTYFALRYFFLLNRWAVDYTMTIFH